MNIIEAYETWKNGIPEYKWPEFRGGSEMDVNEVMLDIEAYVTAKVNEGELGMGFINTHGAAIRSHIENLEAEKAELLEACKVTVNVFEWQNYPAMERNNKKIKAIIEKHKPKAAIAKAEGEKCG